MPNIILTGGSWQQRVRDKLGVDTAYAPDSVIEQPDCITIAESNIIRRIPDYILVSPDNKVYLEYAVVLECCILLCDGMSARLPKKQTGPHESLELETEWLKKKIEFADERDSIIGNILEDDFPDYLSPAPSTFTVTFPKREWEK